MTAIFIPNELDKLADMQAERDVLAMSKQAAIDAVITLEIKAQIADIEAEYAPILEAADLQIQAKTNEIKRLVITCGESFKGTFLHAVFAKGRVSWDTKRLDGYAVAHPEIAAMRSTGEPSVSIRKI